MISHGLPTDLPRQYRYEIKTNLFAGSWRWSFNLIGRHGGVNLHIAGPHGDCGYSAGLEYHWRLPPSYMDSHPPSHDRCWLLDCPCWHDGTSVYASDHYLPMFLAGAYESIFRSLVRDADEKLTPEPKRYGGVARTEDGDEVPVEAIVS